MGFGIYVLLLLLVLGILVIIFCNIKLKKDDDSKEYDLMSVEELGGKFRTLNKGKLAFVFAYDAVEKRKKQVILSKMASISQVADKEGKEYNVGQLVSDAYYFKHFTSKDGPYIAYAVFPFGNEPVHEEEVVEEIEGTMEEEQAGAKE